MHAARMDRDGAGPRLSLGLRHLQTQPIDALVLALGEVRLQS